MYTAEVGFTSYMGQIMPGDEIINMQMLEPITPHCKPDPHLKTLKMKDYY